MSNFTLEHKNNNLYMNYVIKKKYVVFIPTTDKSISALL